MEGSTSSWENSTRKSGYNTYRGWTQTDCQDTHCTILPNADITFVCSVCISDHTANSALYDIKGLIFITEMESVYSAVRTGSLNKAVCCASSLKPTGHVMHQQFNIQQLYALPHTVFMCFVFIWEQTAICASYSINWLVFMTDKESVYCAVRVECL